MHQTGKKSPAEAGPRALAEGGSLDFRNGTIPERGDWFHQESPGTPGAFFVSLQIVRFSGRAFHFVGAAFRHGALPTIL